MSDLVITNSQNVRIRYRTALITRRMLAWFIDSVLCWSYVLALASLPSIELFDFGWSVLLMLPFLLYEPIVETLSSGQTVGKMVMRLRVIRSDGTGISIGDAALRAVLRIIDIGLSLGAVGVISMLVSKYGQRVGDFAASTVVVDERVLGFDRDRALRLVPRQVQYHNVLLLRDRDIVLVKKALASPSSEGSAALISRAAQRVSEVLQVALLPARDLSQDRAFLEKVVADYQSKALEQAQDNH